jgi:tRNA pseudouridine55 synthase
MALGQATRLLEYLEGQSKSYRTEMVVGISTTTQDLEGQVLRRWQVPGLSQEEVEGVLRQFVGHYDQVPPMYSALHHQGRRLYELARAGVEVERPPRRVQIYRLLLLQVKEDFPYW